MEPVRMKLRQATADRKRKAGAKIPEDNKVFDPFSRTKAINKAERNAQAKFIPEVIEQAVIAMFKNDPSRVEKIQTDREAELEKMPPPIDDDEMRALLAEADGIYDEIRECAEGRGKIKMPPGYFNSQKLRVQHSHDRARDFVSWMRLRLEEIPGEIRHEAMVAEASASPNDVPCPVCNAAKWKYCEGIKGAHHERVAARFKQLQEAAG